MLKNYLKLDMRRAFLNWRFPVCILMVCILMLYGSGVTCVISRLEYLLVPLILVAMAVSSIPYAASYVEDYGHKFIIQMQIRGDSRAQYVVSRICVVFLSAFVTFAIGFMLSVVIEYFKIGLIDQESYEQAIWINPAYVNLIVKKDYVLYILAVTVHLSVMTGVMSLIGFVLGQLINNRVAAYCFPMVFIEVQDFLIQRIFGWEKGAGMTLKCLGINQISGVLPGQGVGEYYFQVICYLIIICYFINYINKRKLNG